MTRAALRRFAPLLLVLTLVAIYFVLGPGIPKDQMLHIVLGDAAARVTEVRVGYVDPEVGEAEPTREATFRWAEGAAPRIVTHAPRLHDGEYLVIIDTFARNEHAIVKRRVRLEGAPVSVDVRESVP
jgi:hypothetical protein